MALTTLLAGNRNLAVKDNQEGLITTTVASGLPFTEFRLIDFGGSQYSIRKVTPFGKTSVFLNMGTKPFQVYLEFKREGGVKQRPMLSRWAQRFLRYSGVKMFRGLSFTAEDDRPNTANKPSAGQRLAGDSYLFWRRRKERESMDRERNHET